MGLNLIRSEIRAEIEDLKSLSLERSKLYASFKDQPLLGPLTLTRLEEVLIAEYRAKALQSTYQKRNQEKDSATPDAANKSSTSTQPVSIADAKTSSAPTPSLASSPDKAKMTMTKTTQLASTDPNWIPSESLTEAAVPPEPGQGLLELREPVTTLKKLNALENSALELSESSETPFIFDIPVTYNHRVRQWIRYFQSSGRNSFRIWLERSARFLPIIQYELVRAGLPQDLVYVPMIESGFSPNAVSHAGAMGMWQFIAPTGKRYGLRVDWWLDERKDFYKSTRAAIGYMTDLYRQFNSWYLVAASYNMGENGVRRLIQKHKTNNFWELADKGVLPAETTNYVPKIIAAMLISKAPALYGFRDLDYQMPMSFEYFSVPGGTDLVSLATYLGVSEKYLKVLNPELIKGFVPRQVSRHKIRIPKGSTTTVSQYVRLQTGEEARN